MLDWEMPRICMNVHAYGCGGGQQEVGGFLSSLSFSRDPGEPFPSGTGTNIHCFE